MSEAALKSSPRIDVLTGVRAIAALWVVLYHLSDKTKAVFPEFLFTNKIFVGGYLGVDLFSLLSGFIIAHTYSEAMAERSLAATRRFLWLRGVRTLPLHLFVMLLFVAAVPLGGGIGALAEIPGDGTFWRQLFLLNGVGLETRFAWNVPSWSLGSEWACYLVFPWVAPWIARVSNGAAAGLLAAWSLLLLVFALRALGHPGFDAYLDYGWLRVGGEFLVGCWLQRVHHSGVVARWPLGWITLVGGLALVLAVGFTSWQKLAAWYVAFFALLVLALAHEQAPWPRLLGNRVMLRLGEISYSIYMVHWFVLLNAHHVGLHRLSPELQVAALLLGVIGLSFLTHHFIELGGQRRLRDVFAGRKLTS